MYLACQGGHDSVVTSLIALGSDVNQCDEVGSVIGNEDDARAYSKEFAAVLGTDHDDLPWRCYPRAGTHRFTSPLKTATTQSCWKLHLVVETWSSLRR